MSKIKNGGLDQYGKVWSLNGIGRERVNITIFRKVCVSSDFRFRWHYGDGVGWLFVTGLLQVVIDCAISRDLEYTRANPTFHHWRTESRRYGLAFQNSTDAFHFERGIRVAINSLIQQGRLKFLSWWRHCISWFYQYFGQWISFSCVRCILMYYTSLYL